MAGSGGQDAAPSLLRMTEHEIVRLLAAQSS
jgi:hypothetical protein